MIDGQQLSTSNHQYLFIGSETLTQNGELLRLLETRSVFIVTIYGMVKFVGEFANYN